MISSTSEMHFTPPMNLFRLPNEAQSNKKLDEKKTQRVTTSNSSYNSMNLQMNEWINIEILEN